MTSKTDGYRCHMSAATDIATAERFARIIENAEATRLGVHVREARPVVARKIGASPGTLENLRRGRLKSIPSYLMARIRIEFVAVLQSEVMRLEHEIAIARQTGSHHRENDLVAAETQLVAAKKILDTANGVNTGETDVRISADAGIKKRPRSHSARKGNSE